MGRRSIVLPALILLNVHCQTADAPPPTTPTPTPTTAPTPVATQEPGAACERDEDCTFAAGATCGRGALGPKKGGTCRLRCTSATDARCASPNACISVGPLGDGVEAFSCERTCTTDTDCHVAGLTCSDIGGAPRRCVSMMTGPRR